MSWDDEAATWDDNSAVQAYASAAFACLEEVLEASGTSLAGMRVLDFGCGTGLLTVAMAAHAEEVVGLDLSEAMIERLAAKAVPNVRPRVGSEADPELGAFDLITCSSVCAFLEDYPGTVRALSERLRPGGWFLQWDWELEPGAEEPFGLTRDSVREALEGAGLTGVEVRTAFEIPFEGYRMAPLLGVGRRAS